MTRLAHHEPVAIIACCFIALVPLLLLPILPTRVAAIMHLAAAAPLTDPGGRRVAMAAAAATIVLCEAVIFFRLGPRRRRPVTMYRDEVVLPLYVVIVVLYCTAMY